MRPLLTTLIAFCFALFLFSLEANAIDLGTGDVFVDGKLKSTSQRLTIFSEDTHRRYEGARYVVTLFYPGRNITLSSIPKSLEASLSIHPSIGGGRVTYRLKKWVVKDKTGTVLEPIVFHPYLDHYPPGATPEELVTNALMIHEVVGEEITSTGDNLCLFHFLYDIARNVDSLVLEFEVEIINPNGGGEIVKDTISLTRTTRPIA